MELVPAVPKVCRKRKAAIEVADPVRQVRLLRGLFEVKLQVRRGAGDIRVAGLGWANWPPIL